MQSLLKVAALCCVVLAVTALPTNSDNDLLDGIYGDCLNKDSVSCVKYKLFNFVDKMVSQRSTFALTEGVQIVKTDDAPATAARSISGDESIESLVWNRLQSFLQTHTIKVDLKGADVVNAVANTGRALEDVSETLLGGDETAAEGRGKKKKAAKILGPLLLAVALKAAALLPLLLGAIALIAGKALLVGKLALVLSAVIGLKKLLSHEKHVTYEVVAHPHHSSSHSSSHGEAFAASGFSGDVGGSYGGSSSGGAHGGWGRSSDAQELAYSAQKQ